MKHIGDITKLKAKDITPVDIITFGSPCQNFSLIGDRQGLAGQKSALFFHAIRIIKEMRENTNGIYPTFAIWENVTGALVSGNRLDFRTILESFCSTSLPMPKSKWANAGMVRGKKFELCWRVLDAQYFAVPKLMQRRKRIFIVCDFRGYRSHKILYKPQSMHKDIKTVSDGTNKNPLSNRDDTTKTRRNIPNIRAFQERKMRTGAKQKDKTIFTNSFGKPNEPFPTLLTSNPQIIAYWYDGKEQDGYIRYLTPLEYERLMGLPEDWTKYSKDNTIIKDSARYKAIGNAIAVPCTDYIMAGIQEVFLKEKS